jgi:hypothetical protein
MMKIRNDRVEMPIYNARFLSSYLKLDYAESMALNKLDNQYGTQYWEWQSLIAYQKDEDD